MPISRRNRRKKQTHTNKTRKLLCRDIGIQSISANKSASLRPTKKHGWKQIRVEGDAKTRGYMHGSILAEELAHLLEVFPQFLKNANNISLEEYITLCNSVAKRAFNELCAEWQEELEGMVAGALSRGVVITVDFLFGLNMYLGMDTYFDPNVPKTGEIAKLIPHTNWRCRPKSDHCSAFIATGEATADGKIVMAHNTHCDFQWATFSNVIAHVIPDKGHAFIMQTGPGLLCSSTDWFITDIGIVGTETTIADTTYSLAFGKPYFCRIRECMQYGDSLDDYERIMTAHNAGDYPCGWMFGDIRTNEIMLLELGKKETASRRTRSGVFYGANFAHDADLRAKETRNDEEMQDMGSSLGARNARMDWLLNKEYWGKIDERIAKRIIADHYDMKYGKYRKGDRGICKHAEAEKRDGALYGAVDGKVVNAKMAREMSFWARWGSSCGRVFRVPRSNKDPEYLAVEGFVGEPWTRIYCR